VTNLMPDHQDYYRSMRAYADDKSVIFRNQGPSDWCLLSDGDPWTRAYRPPRPDRTIRVGEDPDSRSDRSGALPADGPGAFGRACFRDAVGVFGPAAGEARVELVPERTRLAGVHMRRNLLFAGVAAYLFGVSEDTVRHRAGAFAGVPHRLEEVATVDGVRYVNDSAATIAEAAAAAVASFTAPVHLIAGGSDKGVPIDAFTSIARAARTLHLLAGTGTDRIVGLLARTGGRWTGPHESLAGAVRAAAGAAAPGDVVLLSPGCASFGMFRNEFDRGDQFRALVLERAT